MFKKIILGALLSVLIIGQLSINSKAAFIDYASSHTEPTCSDTSGYVVIACNNSGTIVFRTYAWTIVPIDEMDSFPTMDFQLGPSGSMTFTAQCVGNAHLTLWELYEDGGFDIVKSTSFSASLPLTYNIYPPYAYSIKGNYGIVPTGYYNTVSVYWASEKQTINQLIQINSLLASMQSSQSSSNDKLTDLNLRVQQMFLLIDDVERLANSTYELLEEYMPYLREELEGVNEELDKLYAIMEDIKAEQEETNSWLEKIFNFLEEKDEKDKEAATQQGSSSTSQGMDAIEDKGGDFASSLGGLTNSMSYSGTQCAWEFPEVKIPAIPGVMDEVVLIRRQPIDFSQWVNAIPSDILLVVQSVCTIGLIVYCFKELYNTIAYVLTLRRDDNE